MDKPYERARYILTPAKNNRYGRVKVISSCLCILAQRLPQEKSTEQLIDSSRQQIHLESVLSQGGLQEATLIASDSDQIRRTALNQLDGNYGGFTIFPQLNHIANNPKDVNESASVSEITSISYPAGTLFSPMNTMTAVMSTGTGMGGCGALLVPLVAGSHGPTLLPPNMTPVSSHLSVVAADHPLLVNTNTTSLASSSMNFISASSSNSVTNSSAVHHTTTGSKSDIKISLSNSELNGRLRNSKDSMEMKPEPLDCFGRVTTGVTEDLLASGNPNELSTIGYPQLTSISPFAIPSTSMTMSTPVSTPPVQVSRVSGIMTSNSTDVSNSLLETTTSSNSKGSATSGPYRCLECDKEFRILRYLEKHRRIHTGEKPYQCCYCGRQFNDWPNMNRHKRIHTGERPYRCTVCTKTFSQPAVYNEHVKRHTGERPYICTVCAKGFPRAARLAVHMRVHTGERPYPCTSCDRRFSQPHHLAAHLRVHSGDRPYSCPKCDVSFACISNLRRHRKQVHPTSPSRNENTDGSNDIKCGNEEKKPSVQIITSVSDNNNSSSVMTMDTPSYIASSSNLTADTPVAIAAAMSGTVLTATGALVPANFLPASSIPGLILTSAAPGALIAAPAHLTEQHSHLHPTIIAHNSGEFKSTTGTLPLIHHDHIRKRLASSSPTMSFMFPTVLTSTPHGDALRQTSVAFLTPTGDLDRSCATLATAGPDGGFILNPVGGDTVYLEPLDPRLTLEPGQQFTLTSIPTSHPQGTLISPHSAAHLMGHQVHLQSGQATHIAFATNIPTHGHQAPHLLTPGSTIFPNTASNQAAIQGSHSSATVIFPPPASIPHSSMSSQQQSVLQSSTEASAPTQLLHYHRPISTTGVLPGRPSSTPTQQQTAMLVPIVHTPPVSGTSNLPNSTCDANESADSTPLTTTWPVSGTFLTFASSHLCPVASSTVVEDQTDTCTLNSRPSSVLSNSSSLGTITAVSVPETSL
ncbi:hypothetical protein MN116_002712 [Schistosoma mekongi]|uniref:C2H2-type domain-containing protein n=1 Tax=Schistosoma mekongi TaxID=38744 RepID=A0AAE1ZEZ7_SCHME|nr:hypothetical protein MN116_002712 [Schistosoma mekongi]